MSLGSDVLNDPSPPEREMILKVEKSKIKQETIKAILVEDGDGVDHWLPKSQLNIDEVTGGVEITLPRWLAEQHPEFEYEEE